MIKRMNEGTRATRKAAMTADWVFVTTILVLGAVTGLVTMRNGASPSWRAPSRRKPSSRRPGRRSDTSRPGCGRFGSPGR